MTNPWVSGPHVFGAPLEGLTSLGIGSSSWPRSVTTAWQRWAAGLSGEGAQEEREGSGLQAPCALPTGATQSGASSLPWEARKTPRAQGFQWGQVTEMVDSRSKAGAYCKCCTSGVRGLARSPSFPMEGSPQEHVLVPAKGQPCGQPLMSHICCTNASARCWWNVPSVSQGHESHGFL